MVCRVYRTHLPYTQVTAPGLLLFSITWACLANYRVFSLMITLLFKKDGERQGQVAMGTPPAGEALPESRS